MKKRWKYILAYILIKQKTVLSCVIVSFTSAKGKNEEENYLMTRSTGEDNWKTTWLVKSNIAKTLRWNKEMKQYNKILFFHIISFKFKAQWLDLHTKSKHGSFSMKLQKQKLIQINTLQGHGTYTFTGHSNR